MPPGVGLIFSSKRVYRARSEYFITNTLGRIIKLRSSLHLLEHFSLSLRFAGSKLMPRPTLLANTSTHLFQLVADDIADDHVQYSEADRYVPNIIAEVVP